MIKIPFVPKYLIAGVGTRSKFSTKELSKFPLIYVQLLPVKLVTPLSVKYANTPSLIALPLTPDVPELPLVP